MLEVLLAMAVVTLLVGVLGLGVAGGTSYEKLDEGARDFETMLRMARAEAATGGRSLMLEVREDGTFAILWEPAPLDEPGYYEPYAGSQWTQSLPQGVRVQRCAVDAAGKYRPPDAAQAMSNDVPPDEFVLDPVQFRPDGSCDSAVIELRSIDRGDERVAILTVDGINAQFTTQYLTPSEFVARQQEQEAQHE